MKNLRALNVQRLISKGKCNVDRADRENNHSPHANDTLATLAQDSNAPLY